MMMRVMMREMMREMIMMKKKVKFDGEKMVERMMMMNDDDEL